MVSKNKWKGKPFVKELKIDESRLYDLLYSRFMIKNMWGNVKFVILKVAQIYVFHLK